MPIKWLTYASLLAAAIVGIAAGIVLFIITLISPNIHFMWSPIITFVGALLMGALAAGAVWLIALKRGYIQFYSQGADPEYVMYEIFSLAFGFLPPKKALVPEDTLFGGIITKVPLQSDTKQLTIVVTTPNGLAIEITMTRTVKPIPELDLLKKLLLVGHGEGLDWEQIDERMSAVAKDAVAEAVRQQDAFWKIMGIDSIPGNLDDNGKQIRTSNEELRRTWAEFKATIKAALNADLPTWGLRVIDLRLDPPVAANDRTRSLVAKVTEAKIEEAAETHKWASDLDDILVTIATQEQMERYRSGDSTVADILKENSINHEDFLGYVQAKKRTESHERIASAASSGDFVAFITAMLQGVGH